MKNIIIWGAGKRTAVCIERKLFEDNKILAVVDSYINDKQFMGYPLIRPNEISSYEPYDFIVVTNQFYQEIVIQLLELHVPLEKIIITDNVKEQPFKKCYEKAKEVIPQVHKLTENSIKQIVKSNERDYADKNSIYVDDRFNDLEYDFDYFRYRTFEFVAEKIAEDDIEGSLAEVGVFRGLFSAVINYRLPERKIYLFDTFEGFNEEEAKREYEKGRCDLTFIESHKDTSIERMLSNIPHSERAVICKGFFPDSVTAEAENEKYAFVSLDVDFEDSTFEGLKFFYPRLSEGGYIFVHDYNTYYLDGIKIAVKRYEEYIGQKLKTVPIADRAGTLIIVK